MATRTTAAVQAPQQIFQDFKSEHTVLAELIAQVSDNVPGVPIRILEAGCGQRWPLRIAGVRVHITGVDTDADAMRIRRAAHADLDAEIVGDLRTVELPQAAFDISYCSFVLEHVDGAERVLEQLRLATRPGGRLVIRVPDRDSVYGFIVRHSPHRIHVLYKRYIEGFADAGKPGHAPYPTVYDEVVSLRGLRDYARAHDLEVVAEYGSNAYLMVFKSLRPAVAGCLKVISWISRGRVLATHNNIGIVLQIPNENMTGPLRPDSGTSSPDDDESADSEKLPADRLATHVHRTIRDGSP